MGNPHQLSCPYFVHMILRTVKIPSNVEVMYKVFFERITMIQAKMEFDALEFAHGWDGRPWGCPETGHQQSGVRAPNHSDPGFHQHCLLRGIQGYHRDPDIGDMFAVFAPSKVKFVVSKKMRGTYWQMKTHFLRKDNCLGISPYNKSSILEI